MYVIAKTALAAFWRPFPDAEPPLRVGYHLMEKGAFKGFSEIRMTFAGIPEAEPRAVLQFLMEQHGLKQTDLADCAPQSRISEILSGQRAVSKALAKRFAAQFRVPMELFL